MYNIYRLYKIKEGANEFRNISKIVFRIKNSLDTALSATNAGKRYRADVKNGIATGEIIEDYPEDYPNPSCLIFGYNVNGRILHIVAGCDNINIYIITAYYPDTKKFEDDLKTRRKR